jgi:hypothetical protein
MRKEWNVKKSENGVSEENEGERGFLFPFAISQSLLIGPSRGRGKIATVKNAFATA